MLATLTRPDEGVATVGGHDVLRHADRVRRRLDPGRREHLWRIIRELTTAGSTVLLTTQYLGEAATQPG